MGEIILTAVNAVAPIILLILLGYFLKRIKFLNESFLKSANKLVFRVCLPVMLFVNVYDIESFSSIRWDVVLYAVIAVLVIFSLGLITCIITTKNPKRRGVILQCTFRSNFAIIGLSLAASLGGSEASAVAAIISAFTIPLYNILAVVALTVFTGGKKQEEEVLVSESQAETLNTVEPKKAKSEHNIKSILLNIVKNPLIIGVVLGLVCLGIRQIEISACGEVVFSIQGNIKFLYTALSNIKSIASPLALIVLGGQFEFSAVKGMLKEIIVGTSWRIIIAPLLGIGVAVLLSNYTNLISFGVNEYPALIALFGSPVAVSSAIMAGEMGSDEQLATQLVVWTSICSILTIFVTVCILMYFGLLVV